MSWGAGLAAPARALARQARHASRLHQHCSTTPWPAAAQAQSLLARMDATDRLSQAAGRWSWNSAVGAELPHTTPCYSKVWPTELTCTVPSPEATSADVLRVAEAWRFNASVTVDASPLMLPAMVAEGAAAIADTAASLSATPETPVAGMYAPAATGLPGDEEPVDGIQASSVLKKRRRKMNKHKYRKWRKKMRNILRKRK